jgi:hypothetical protein
MVMCGTIEQREGACVEPLTGAITEQRSYDCDAGGWTAWVETANTCIGATFVWTPLSAATGPFASPLANQVGDACSPQGAMASCSANAGGGLGHYHYSSCSCQ